MTRNPSFSSIAGPDHPDFQLPWIQKLLSDPNLEILRDSPTAAERRLVTNAMWQETLSHERGVKARLQFRRPTSEPDSISKNEIGYIISIGPGIDGRVGRAHGGFSSLVLDQLTGNCARRENVSPEPPATATMTVDYLAPIGTPGVFVGRSWPTEISGRKIWTKGVLENEDGKPYAIAKALFINPRTQPKGGKL